MSSRPPRILAGSKLKPVLSGLRRQIAAIERRPEVLDSPAGTPPSGWRLGIAEIDAALGPGLTADGLHEVVPAGPHDGAAAAGFALALLARRLATAPANASTTVLWCETQRQRYESGALHGPGLQSFGVMPDNFLFIRTRKDTGILWAMEEGLRSTALAAVIGEAENPSFTATRRLSLAAQAARMPALLIRAPARTPATAARTRWHVANRPSATPAYDIKAPGFSRWHIALTRCRGGQPHQWTVDWNHETGSFRLAAALADRSAAPRGASAAGAG